MGAKDAEAGIESMTATDLDQILAIEAVSFPTPWSRASFLFELRENPFAWNVVFKERGSVLAYACLWIVDRELKINNIAVRASARRRGIARRLLGAILDRARERGCTEATLEVRPSNVAARALYSSFGFRDVGRRKGYYQDTREDAILMSAGLRPESEDVRS